MPVDPFQYSTPQANLLVKRLIVTDYANIPGGSSTGVAFGFVYTASGSENPAGFVVAIPGLPVSYTAQVQVSSGRGFIASQTAPASWTSSGVTVQTGNQLNAGDTVTVQICPT